MATNSLQSLSYRHRTPPLGRRRRHSLDSPPPPSLSISPTTTTTTTTPNSISISISSSSIKTFSVSSSSSTTTTTQPTTSFDLLHRLLSANDFREADNETRRLIILLAGDAAQKRGYVFFSEVQFIPESDLKTIDNLWRTHSNNKFGYSVQKRIWEKCERDFTKFFIKVGWMKKLETEVVQYNYRAFPDEFTWELTGQTPEGHLPLTNALRGTQLLSCILSHPAFEDNEQVKVVEEEEEGRESESKSKSKSKVPLGFKTNYSF